jgi:hypothetical protein
MINQQHTNTSCNVVQTPRTGATSLLDMRVWSTSLLHCRVARTHPTADAAEPVVRPAGGQEGHPTPLSVDGSGKEKPGLGQSEGLVYSPICNGGPLTREDIERGLENYRRGRGR